VEYLERNRRARTFREAGAVQRCHTVPHHGCYDIAQHSWNMAMLLYQFHPNPSTELIYAVLSHDVAERFTGDTPAPARWAFPPLRESAKVLEKRINHFLGIDLELSEEDALWLSALDRIEFWMWTHDQLAMGNQHVKKAHEAIFTWLAQNIDDLPKPLPTFVGNFDWDRESDYPPKECLTDE
jgi:5'-deoxynucleotidase YfbR-like HD superfamily hydrolase